MPKDQPVYKIFHEKTQRNPKNTQGGLVTELQKPQRNKENYFPKIISSCSLCILRGLCDLAKITIKLKLDNPRIK
jgi:hypothetical protein